jgi:hypothetical protein
MVPNDWKSNYIWRAVAFAGLCLLFMSGPAGASDLTPRIAPEDQGRDAEQGQA